MADKHDPAADPVDDGDRLRKTLVAGLDALFRWPATLGPDDIPMEARRRAALIVADDMGAMAAGLGVAEVASLHKTVSGRPGEPESSIVGSGFPRLRREEAAFANAVSANWCELDEGYKPIACHGGLYTVPAVLAEAEATGAPVSAALDAIIVGYETATRLARCFAGPRLTVHPHAALSAIGATAALAHLRSLPAEQRISAIGAAATMAAPGPWSHAMGGLQVRNAWAGHGAMTAFRALTCAGAGLDGASSGVMEVLWDIMGSRLEGDPDPGYLGAGLGRQWAVSDGYHKLYACCQYAHASVQAALDIRKGGLPDDWETELAAIEVETHPLALNLSNASPPSDLAARFSLPHATAVALLTGKADPASFAGERLSDPRINRLRQMVRLSLIGDLPDPPMDRPSRVTVVLNGDRRYSAHCDSAPGSPDKPLTRTDVLNKAGPALADHSPALGRWLEPLTDLDADVLSQPFPSLGATA